MSTYHLHYLCSNVCLSIVCIDIENMRFTHGIRLVRMCYFVKHGIWMKFVAVFVNEMYNLCTNCVGCVGWNGKIAQTKGYHWGIWRIKPENTGLKWCSLRFVFLATPINIDSSVSVNAKVWTKWREELQISRETKGRILQAKQIHLHMLVCKVLSSWKAYWRDQIEHKQIKSKYNVSHI